MWAAPFYELRSKTEHNTVQKKKQAEHRHSVFASWLWIKHKQLPYNAAVGASPTVTTAVSQNKSSTV